MTRLPMLTAIVLATTQCMSGIVLADFDDFESFSPNASVNSQGGWTVEDSFGNSSELFDEEIVDDGTGNQVWRISNEFTTTSYSNQPFSSKADQVAGESGAGLFNDYGSDHSMPNSPPLSSAASTSKYFYTGFDFKSATDGAQTGLSITVSPSASQSTLRMSYLRITDSGTGYDVDFFDTTGSSFGNTVLATGLSYDDWHRLEMFVEFVDGIGPGTAGSEQGNDLVAIYLDGVLLHTGTTWESYFYNVADAGIPVTSKRAVDSALFRMAGNANSGNSGGGFFIDNVDVSNAMIPEPQTLCLCMLGGMYLASTRVRRHCI